MGKVPVPNFLETVFHLDLDNDLSGIVEFAKNAPEDPNDIFAALCQLLTRARLRSAFTVAMHLTDLGYQHIVISIVLHLGSMVYNIQTQWAGGLANLRRQADEISAKQRETIYDTVITPVLADLLRTALRNADTGRILWILEILKAADLRFRTRLEWNLAAPPLSLETMRQQGQARARLLTLPTPPSGIPRPQRRVVVVQRTYLFAHQRWPYSRPLDTEARMVAALTAYGWHATLCPIPCVDLVDDYRVIAATCEQQQADLLIVDEDLFLTKKNSETTHETRVAMIATLRKKMPALKVAGLLLHAEAVHSDLLRKTPDLLDLLLGSASPDLPLWDETNFAHKVLPIPLPHASHAPSHNPPLSGQMLFIGEVTHYTTFWLSAAAQMGLPIQKNMAAHYADGPLPTQPHEHTTQEIIKATCCLHLSSHPDMACPVTHRCFETLLSGSLLIQEASSHMDRYFVAGEHYLEFSNLAELSSIVRFITENQEEAEKIRRQGQAFAHQHYGETTLIGYLDHFLYGPDPATAPMPSPGIPPEMETKKLISYEYISVRRWCQSVPPDALLAGSGNRVYFHDFKVTQPPINLQGLRARGQEYEALFPCDEAFVGASMPNFDFKTHRMISHTTPFVARLEDVRIESPGFSILLDRHLIMEESYHQKSWTNAVIKWYGTRSVRRTHQMTLDVEREEDTFQSTLDVHYYIDYGIDQYEEGPAILISGPSWANYHHWMVEMLPKIWCMSFIPELKNLPLILFGRLFSFQRETLAALNIPLERIRLFTGKTLQVKTLIFPSHIAPLNASIHNVTWLRETLLPAFQVEIKPPTGLIYISRGQAPSRRLINEEHLIRELQSRGFHILHLETMTVKEQLEAFSNAKMVIMPHGAAGTNIIFSQPGTLFIELLSYSYRHAMHAVYASLNDCLYGCLICNDSSSTKKRDMVVDVNTLLRVVDKALTD